ncbi:hypothetical protein RKD33_007578 [Streptomyces sp. SAI-129]
MSRPDAHDAPGSAARSPLVPLPRSPRTPGVTA